jgi:hypothetical protein
MAVGTSFPISYLSRPWLAPYCGLLSQHVSRHVSTTCCLPPLLPSHLRHPSETNTATSKFYRLPIGKILTVPAGAQAELLASNLPRDDFVLDAAGFAYAGGQAGVINFVDPSKGTVRAIAGTLGLNSSALVGPTTVQFGRTASDRNNIYLTTDGGILNTILGSQGVSRIDVGDVAGY